MAQLAIRGHITRGNEVIEILEMLGGINEDEYAGDRNFAYYFINNNYIDWRYECIPESNFISFTLEEFLEKFPYKVRDRVRVAEYESEVRIDDMKWDGNEVQYKVFTDETEWYSSEELNLFNEPCKEETTEEIKIEIPAGYEFAGVDDNAQQVVFTKIQPQYPKTYKECFNICFGDHHPVIQVIGLDGLGGNKALFERFIKLKICRDAYWKIAGEQLGLDKPWEPDWTNPSERKYCITNIEGNITTEWVQTITNKILAFPTAEMRDAFKENFDSDIEFCKEFL